MHGESFKHSRKQKFTFNKGSFGPLDTLHCCWYKIICKGDVNVALSAFSIESTHLQAHKYITVSSPSYLSMVCFKNALHACIGLLDSWCSSHLALAPVVLGHKSHSFTWLMLAFLSTVTISRAWMHCHISPLAQVLRMAPLGGRFFALLMTQIVQRQVVWLVIRWWRICYQIAISRPFLF